MNPSATAEYPTLLSLMLRGRPLLEQCIKLPLDAPETFIESVDVGSNSRLNSLLLDGFSHFAPSVEVGGRSVGTRSGFGRPFGPGVFGGRRGGVVVAVVVVTEC